MPYRAVLFDLDGTLLDTLEDVADATNRIMARRGYPTHTVEAFKMFIGDGARMIVTRALPEDKRSDEIIQQAVSEWQVDYGQNCYVKTRPYPGIPELLDRLSADGVPMTIVTNKPDKITRLLVAELLPGWKFEAIIGARPDLPRKPNPAGALLAAQQLGIPPADFLYLGDTGTDMQTARAAGMFAVGVLWGFRQGQELLDNGAQVLIERPEQLLDLL